MRMTIKTGTGKTFVVEQRGKEWFIKSTSIGGRKKLLNIERISIGEPLVFSYLPTPQTIVDKAINYREVRVVSITIEKGKTE